MQDEKPDYKIPDYLRKSDWRKRQERKDFISSLQVLALALFIGLCVVLIANSI